MEMLSRSRGPRLNVLNVPSLKGERLTCPVHGDTLQRHRGEPVMICAVCENEVTRAPRRPLARIQRPSPAPKARYVPLRGLVRVRTTPEPRSLILGER